MLHAFWCRSLPGGGSRRGKHHCNLVPAGSPTADCVEKPTVPRGKSGPPFNPRVALKKCPFFEKESDVFFATNFWEKRGVQAGRPCVEKPIVFHNSLTRGASRVEKTTPLGCCGLSTSLACLVRKSSSLHVIMFVWRERLHCLVRAGSASRCGLLWCGTERCVEVRCGALCRVASRHAVRRGAWRCGGQQCMCPNNNVSHSNKPLPLPVAADRTPHNKL